MYSNLIVGTSYQSVMILSALYSAQNNSKHTLKPVERNQPDQEKRKEERGKADNDERMTRPGHPQVLASWM